MNLHTKSKEAMFGVVLLHGFGMHSDEMVFLGTKLSEQYKEKILIINSKAREGNTVNCSIEKQAKIVYGEVMATLKKHHKNGQSFPLFIIGQSQGGVVATFIAKTYKDKLNLLGFITHNSPLKGAHLLTCGPGDVLKFQARAAKGLNIIGAQKKRELIIQGFVTKYRNYIGQLFEHIGISKFAGVRDMLPDSPCMTSVCEYLTNVQPDPIPGLLIGSFQNDYGKLFSDTIERYKDKHKGKRSNIHDEVNQAIETLNKASATLLTGDENGLHDLILSLKSQLCRRDSFENLIDIGSASYYIVMPNNPNVTCVVLKGVTHCPNLFPIDSDCYIEPSNENAREPRRMPSVLFEFMDKHLNNVT